MSSDYIPRLRRELLRAGASRQPRRARVTHGLRPVAAGAATVAAAALLALALVMAWPDGAGEERTVDQPADALRLVYRLEPSGAPAAEKSAQVLRARLAAAGIDDARVAVSSGAEVTVTAPASVRADVTALARPGRLAIYDWERSVLGPRGAPAPGDPSVTGGPDAGRAGGLTRTQAEARAAEVPGARVVEGEGDGPQRWFVLGGEPALTNGDAERATAAVDERMGEPIVDVELTAGGERAFAALTEALARRGEEAAAPRDDELEALQHFAIVIDDRIVSVPFIDFRAAPDGLDGSAGVWIEGDLTPQTARRLAAILDAGPLPSALVARDG